MRKYAPLLLLVLLAACGDDGKKGPPGAAPGAAMPPPEVDVIIAAAGSATITQDLPGRLQAVRSAQVRARVEGVVEKRLFAEGTDITAGTPLFQINTHTYQAQAAAAVATASKRPLTSNPIQGQRIWRSNFARPCARICSTMAPAAVRPPMNPLFG